jgi:hypothetical protein
MNTTGRTGIRTLSIRLATLLAASLVMAGCAGTSAAQPPATATPSASATATKAPATMPDVKGKTYGQAKDLLTAAGVSFDALSSDKKFTGVGSIPATAVVVEADAAPGDEIPAGNRVYLHLDKTSIELAAAATAAKEMAARGTGFSFTCSSQSAMTDKTAKTVHSFKEVWSLPDFASLRDCDGRVGTTWWHDKYPLTADEQAVVDRIGADGGDISSPSGAFSDVLEACLIAPDIDWDASKGVKVRVQAVAKAALKMCPDAPFAAELTRVAAGEPRSKFDDGNYTIGTDIAAGTYQVQVPEGANGVHDCYWERAGAQGGIIANNFITFAPQGPVVAVYAGEGFTSKECGTWQKIR